MASLFTPFPFSLSPLTPKRTESKSTRETQPTRFMLSGGWAWQKLVSLPFARVSLSAPAENRANIYTATLLQTVLYTYSRMLHLLVSLFVFFHLSVALPFFSLLTPCPLDGVRGCKKDGERGERSSALGGKVSRRAATISSLHGNAPSTPFSFATGTRLTLDKRTRSVVMFFVFF